MLEELHGTFMGANALGLVLDPDWRPPADPKVIPVRLLRKLHANLNDFIVEAKAAENAWLLREASR